ncbi:MAG: hypothetical protein QGG69_02350 [Kiritimatiellia bacterium]|nr:hypothetical protein [Kiritimatiellia bacterium]
MKRTMVAVFIGLVGSLLIWTLGTASALIGTGGFCTDYLPVGAVALMLVIVFGLNPLLSLISLRMVLNRVQLALVFGMLLVASVTSDQGLLLPFLFPLANCTQNACEDPAMAELYEKMDAPAALFPDKLEFGSEPFAANRLLNGLEPGEQIPWKSWGKPLIAWLGLLVPWWVMMIAIAMIALPQWRDRERVTFPLLEVQKAISSAPATGRRLPGIFRDRLLLTGLGLSFFIIMLSRVSAKWPGMFPAIPLSFDMSPYFTEGFVRHLPGWISGRYTVRFVVVGLAFFMQKRVSFSIWSIQLIAGLLIAMVTVYSPPFEWGCLMPMKLGVHFGIAAGVLWLARSHLAHIGSTFIKGVRTDAERRDRLAAAALLLSLVAMFIWFTWVGVHPGWSVGIILVAFVFGIVYARIVAETGLPIVSSTAYYGNTLIALVPVAWRTAASMYFAGIMAVFVGYMNRMCAATVVLHALGLDEKAGARKHVRLGVLFLGVLVASCVIAGATYLVVGYEVGETISGDNIVGWWRGVFPWTAEGALKAWGSGKILNTKPALAWFILYGALLAGLMQWLCSFSVKWPFHPLGLLLIATWTGNTVWFSVFVGWLLKTLVMKYGGARNYARGRSLFLGLILGEVTGITVWTLINAALLASEGG